MLVKEVIVRRPLFHRLPRSIQALLLILGLSIAAMPIDLLVVVWRLR